MWLFRTSVCILVAVISFVKITRGTTYDEKDDDYAFEWVEKLVKHPFLFTQATGMLDRNEFFFSFDDEALAELHRENSRIPVFMTGSCPVEEKVEFPYHHPYLHAMRLSLAIEHDMTWLWRHYDGVLPRAQIVSLANERSALHYLASRLRSLYEILPPGTLLLTHQEIIDCLQIAEDFVAAAQSIVTSLLAYDDPYYARKWKEPYQRAAYCNPLLLRPYLKDDGLTLDVDEITALVRDSPMRHVAVRWLKHYLSKSIIPYLLDEKCVADTAIYRFYRRDLLTIYTTNWSDTTLAEEVQAHKQRFVMFQSPLARDFHQDAPKKMSMQRLCLLRAQDVLNQLEMLQFLQRQSGNNELLRFQQAFQHALQTEDSNAKDTWDCSLWIRDVYAATMTGDTDGRRVYSPSLELHAGADDASFFTAITTKPRKMPVSSARQVSLFTAAEKSMLESIHDRAGAGCSTAVTLACLTPMTDAHPKTQGTLCIGLQDSMHAYIHLHVVPAFALVPDPLWLVSYRKYRDRVREAIDADGDAHVASTAVRLPTKPPRIMIAGLGGGSLTTFLRLYFPGSYIESVDIDAATIDMYRRYFQAAQWFDHGPTSSVPFELSTQEPSPALTSWAAMICGIKQLVTPSTETADDTTGWYLRDWPLHSATPSSSAPTNVSKTVTEQCNTSYFIWANAFQYIEYRAATQAICQQNAIDSDRSGIDGDNSDDNRTGHHCFYDHIVFDAYDGRVLEWNSVQHSGQSLAFVPQVIDSLDRIRRLLRPRQGIVHFHLHKDGQYRALVRHIAQVFGERQVVVFDSGVDTIVVAGRDVFVSSDHSDEDVDGNDLIASQRPHPCDNPTEFLHWVTVFGESLWYPPGLAMRSKYALRCQWQEDVAWVASASQVGVDGDVAV